MDSTSEQTGSRAQSWKGTIKNLLGWATGDRRVEAEGAAEERLGAPPSEEEVERTEKAVKRNHGDTVDGRLPPPET